MLQTANSMADELLGLLAESPKKQAVLGDRCSGHPPAQMQRIFPRCYLMAIKAESNHGLNYRSD